VALQRSSGDMERRAQGYNAVDVGNVLFAWQKVSSLICSSKDMSVTTTTCAEYFRWWCVVCVGAAVRFTRKAGGGENGGGAEDVHCSRSGDRWR
jgi:hypothetical protein